MSRNSAGLCALVIVAALSGACANTVKGAQKDTEKVVEKTAAATNTVDVKSALIADGRVDASNINVDTSASTKTVVLKGTVPTAQQRATAEAIARDNADGYTINNQLTVARGEAVGGGLTPSSQAGERLRATIGSSSHARNALTPGRCARAFGTAKSYCSCCTGMKPSPAVRATRVERDAPVGASLCDGRRDGVVIARLYRVPGGLAPPSSRSISARVPLP